MIDYDFSKRKLFNEEFVSILKKYAVILAVTLLLRTGFYMLLPVLTSMFNIMDAISYNVGITGSLYLFNLITAIFIYSDMNRLNSVSWSIIALTLLSNEAGVLFFLVYILYHSLQRDGES